MRDNLRDALVFIAFYAALAFVFFSAWPINLFG